MKPTLRVLIQFAELNGLAHYSFEMVLEYYNSTVQYGPEGCGCIMPNIYLYDNTIGYIDNLPF